MSGEQSAAAGGSFTWGGGGGSGYISLSQDKMNSDYASVTGQSGMFAGNGGFDITTGNHTQLNGGVIASGACADKNRLDTGTLGWNDIHNEASYSVDSSSVSMSSSGNSASQFMGNMANAMLAGLNGDGSASSTTGSAIAGGTIVIRDQDAQKQDVASLNRDTDNAHSTLAPIFDAAKEQQRIDENRAIAQIGSQVADIVRTEGKIAAQEAAKEQLAKEGKLPPTPEEGATQDKWDRYNETLANTDAYKTAMNEYGTGSNKQQAIQAITAAIQGLTGGDWSSAVAGAAAPYMAEFIKNNTAEGAERIISHALAGAIVAEMQGGNAAAGAAGAGLSAAGAKYIADQLYPGKDLKDLTEEEKQGVVALATLASGIAGGVVGGDVNSAIAGGKAGKNEVTNNMFLISMLPEMMAANSAAMAGAAGSEDALNKDKEAALALDKAIAEFGRGAVDTCVNGGACQPELMLALVVIAKLKGASAVQSDTGGNQLAGTDGIRDTGGDQQFDSNGVPNNTGNQENTGSKPTDTGNRDGAIDTGGNTTTTPVADGTNPDDLTYISEGDKPANMSPEGSGRAGAFNEAKRQSGIPVSLSPSVVIPNVDKRGNPQPGYIYVFDIPKSGGGTIEVRIRDDAGGHFFNVDDPQNRGPHFNDETGNHYDY